jgi:glucose-1-phosphate adenylyltransferase
VIGYDPKADRERYYLDESSGIAVIPMPPLKLRKDLELPKSMNVEIP